MGPSWRKEVTEMTEKEVRPSWRKEVTEMIEKKAIPVGEEVPEVYS